MAVQLLPVARKSSVLRRGLQPIHFECEEEVPQLTDDLISFKVLAPELG